MPKSLTIQFVGKDDRLPVEPFLEVLKKTVEALHQLEANLSVSGRPSGEWDVVQASMQSPLILTLAPGGEVDEDTSEQVVHAYLHGLRELERAPAPPPYFGDETLKAVKSILGTLTDGVASIRYSAPGEQPVVPTLHAAAHITEIIDTASTPLYEHGTIEGNLEVVSTHRGDSCTIWEVFTKQRVECRLTPEQLEQAKKALRQRVAVSGKIKYRRRGEPASIEVESIRVLRTASQLPQPGGIGPIDLTAGVPSEDHVRKQRDAE